MAPWIIPFQLHHWSGATDTTGFRALLFCLLDLGCLHSESSHQQIQTVLLLPSQFGCLLFLLLVWLLWLGLPVLCWIGVEGESILVLFLISVKSSKFFYHWVWCWLQVSCIWPLLCWGMFLLFPFCWRFFINGSYTLSNAFSTSIDMIMWFLSFILFMWWIICIDLWMLY